MLKVSRRAINQDNQANINAKEISEVSTPLPTLEQQKAIVEYINMIKLKLEKIIRLQKEIENDFNELVSSFLYEIFNFNYYDSNQNKLNYKSDLKQKMIIDYL